MSDPLMLFVDDERPAPADWILAKTAAEAVDILESFRKMDTLFDVVSLDYDLGLAGGNTEPVLEWLRDYKAWPTELYVHTANADAQSLLVDMVREWAPKGTLRGFGCNFWGTGPDTRMSTFVDVDGQPEPASHTVVWDGPLTPRVPKAHPEKAPALAGVNDLPAPIPNDLPSAHDDLVADVLQRKDLGLDRYGTALQPYNGRDSLLDGYEEVLDLAAYMRNAITEKRLRRAKGRALLDELADGRELNVDFVEELYRVAFE